MLSFRFSRKKTFRDEVSFRTRLVHMSEDLYTYRAKQLR
jgi:hypothetical protein